MIDKKKKEHFFRSAADKTVHLYLFLMVGVFPLYYEHHYLDIVSAKKSFFQTMSLIFILCILIFGIGGGYQPDRIKKWKKEISLTDICVMVFLMVVVISCLSSPEGSEAFWGMYGRKLGGAYLLLCGAIYFTLSRSYKMSRLLRGVFLAANIVVWVIVVCNFWGWDPLGMYGDLIESQHVFFMGTMGNKNINSGYSGVVLVLMMGLYHLEQERLTRGFFWGAVMLGTYACYCTRSDSWLLAAGSGAILLLGIAMKERKMLRWCGLGAAIFVGSAFMGSTVALDAALEWDDIFIQDLRGQKILYMLIGGKSLLFWGGVLLLFFLVAKNDRIAGSRIWQKLQKYGPWVLFAAVAAGIAILLWRIFPLDDAFGSNRGYIWKRTVSNFRAYPFWQKLFGYGPNCFLQSMEKTYGAEMRQVYVNPFIDAHNECLQFLAVTGILGALSYMGIQISLLVTCLRKRKNQPGLLLGAVGILAYLMQGLVNNPQVFTTPLYFIFLGIFSNVCRTCSMNGS